MKFIIAGYKDRFFEDIQYFITTQRIFIKSSVMKKDEDGFYSFSNNNPDMTISDSDFFIKNNIAWISLNKICEINASHSHGFHRISIRYRDDEKDPECYFYLEGIKDAYPFLKMLSKELDFELISNMNYLKNGEEPL